MEKNKDPLNDSVVDQCKAASNKLTRELFVDLAGTKEDNGEGKRKRKKGASFQTVSNLYREQVRV